MPKLRNGSRVGFEPGLSRLLVRHSTAELPRSRITVQTMHKLRYLPLVQDMFPSGGRTPGGTTERGISNSSHNGARYKEAQLYHCPWSHSIEFIVIKN